MEYSYICAIPHAYICKEVQHLHNLECWWSIALHIQGSSKTAWRVDGILYACSYGSFFITETADGVAIYSTFMHAHNECAQNWWRPVATTLTGIRSQNCLECQTDQPYSIPHSNSIHFCELTIVWWRITTFYQNDTLSKKSTAGAQIHWCEKHSIFGIDNIGHGIGWLVWSVWPAHILSPNHACKWWNIIEL
jgi:hypothetical protein